MITETFIRTVMEASFQEEGPVFDKHNGECRELNTHWTLKFVMQGDWQGFVN